MARAMGQMKMGMEAAKAAKRLEDHADRVWQDKDALPGKKKGLTKDFIVC